MARHPRIHIQSRPLMEFSNRIAQGLHLLQPQSTLNQLVVGALARAQKLYPMKIHAAAFLGNHWHILATPDSVEQQARFFCHFTRAISIEIQRLRNWEGTVFPKRYHAAEISTEPEMQMRRLKYVLSNSAKEGLCASPLDWPGAPFAKALVTGEPLRGIWINRSALYKARQRGKDVCDLDFAQEELLFLDPLPCLEHLDPSSQRSCIADTIREIEHETQLKHHEQGTNPIGSKKLLAMNPLRRPKSFVGSPQPRFHAWNRQIRQDMSEAMQWIIESYRSAASDLKLGLKHAIFPENCFPPGLPFVPAGSTQIHS